MCLSCCQRVSPLQQTVQVTTRRVFENVFDRCGMLYEDAPPPDAHRTSGCFRVWTQAGPRGSTPALFPQRPAADTGNIRVVVVVSCPRHFAL